MTENRGRGLPLALRLAIQGGRIYLLLAIGLGITSFALPGIRGHLLLVGIAALLGWRLTRARELFWIPDGLLVCLPYFWAMNATDAFQSWWSWMVPAYLLALSLTLWVFFLHWVGRPPWRTQGMGRGIFLAFVFLTVFSAGLKLIFPLFSLWDYRKILLSGFFFFGGIPICQVAGIGLLFASDSFAEGSSGGE